MTQPVTRPFIKLIIGMNEQKNGAQASDPIVLAVRGMARQ